MRRQRVLHRVFFALYAGGVGFLALLVQVLVTRELLASFFGDELLIGLVLAAWLLLVALGAWMASGLRLGAVSWHLGVAFVLLAPAIPWAVYVARVARSMGDWPGQVVGPGAALMWAGAALLAPCVLLGAAFAMSVQYAEGRLPFVGIGMWWGERAPSRVYMIESLGALVAGLLFHFFWADHLVAMYLAVFLGAGALLAGLALVATDGRPRRTPYKLILVEILPALLAVTGAVLHLSDAGIYRLEARSLAARWQGFDLIASRNTRYGNVAITASGSQKSVFYDGLLAFTTEDTVANEELAHLGLLSADLERIHRKGRPVRVLVVGGALGGLLREIAREPVDEVDYVELDAQALRIIAAYVGTGEIHLFGTRLHIILADLRSLDLGKQRYAAIIYNLPPPSNALLARAYSEGFLRRSLAPALDPDGAMILRLPGPQTTLGPDRAMLHASVFRALEGAGLEPTVAVGDAGIYLISSRQAIKAPVLVARLVRRHIKTSFVTAEHLANMLLPFRQEMYLRSIRAASAAATTDARPACYRYYLALSAREFSPRLADAIDAAPRVLPIAGAAAVALVIFLILGARGAGASIAMACCGFAAMALTFTIMLEFQIRAGVLFHQIGLLTALFMGGLAAGSWLARRCSLALGFGALAAAAAVPWLMSVRPDLFPLASVSIACGAASFVGGLGGGMVYPLAVALAGGEASPAAARLYALDLAASAVAAVVTAVVVVPVAGIPWACATVALACGLGATASLARRSQRSQR